MFDVKFWVAVSFVIFVLLVAKTIYKIVTQGLDSVTESIKAQIHEADIIKQDAVKIKEEFLKQTKLNNQKAKLIVENAIKSAEKFILKEQEFLNNNLQKRREYIVNLIKDMKNMLVEDLRNQSVESALKRFKKYLQDENLDAKLYKKSFVELKNIV